MKKLIFILAALSFSLETNTVNATPTVPATALNGSAFIRITSEQVTTYLQCHGYVVFSVWATEDPKTWLAYTQLNGKNYQTMVYTDGVNIIGHEDMPI
ncbi:MAG: hypothetical protein ACJ76F_11600 [Bacteroidia bacterium]